MGGISLPNQNQMPDNSMPFGVGDLDPRLEIQPGRIRCVVRGCEHFLSKPGTRPSSVCPTHGIRCHSSEWGDTYSFANPRRNILVDSELYDLRVVSGSMKQAKSYFGLENSEDDLTWNVFRSLQKERQLARFANTFFGVGTHDEPDLYLWGIRLTDDSFIPWDLLNAARNSFESRMPPDRKRTEPDVALLLPGRYLILIEAKFRSENSVCSGPKAQYTVCRYPCINFAENVLPEQDCEVAVQLWRNMAFVEWMSLADSKVTRPFLANLVPDCFETGSFQGFHKLIRESYKHYVKRITWEQVYEHLDDSSEAIRRLRAYMVNKTAYLRKAFWI